MHQYQRVHFPFRNQPDRHGSLAEGRRRISKPPSNGRRFLPIYVCPYQSLLSCGTIDSLPKIKSHNRLCGKETVNYTELKLQFEQSPALRLLRAENASLVLTVLFAAFKHEHRPVVLESRLRALLEAELEELRDAAHIVSWKAAKDYLLEWADNEHNYVRRFQPPDADEPAYELTSDLERVFQWLESLRPRGHVGTESKFKNLANLLVEIVENSTREPDVRIQQLRAEQTRLQRQIEEIEKVGVVPIYNATQINERFSNLLETARKLLGDFREVEHHFRKVTEDIVVRRADASTTRGVIVGQTLDAHERLRESSQGQSFYAFWDFLLASERRREFSALVEKVYALPELDEELRADALLSRLQLHLRAEGSKVLTSNERLVAQLRRILDTRESAERREVGRLLQEIKALAHESRHLPANSELLELDGPIVASSLMSKAQWSPPERIDFGGELEVDSGTGDYKSVLQAFLLLHPVDFDQLRSNIRKCLEGQVQVSLPELLEVYPPRNGILEVLAYVVIAESDGPHVIFDEFDLIDLHDLTDRRYRVPRVIFSNT